MFENTDYILQAVIPAVITFIFSITYYFITKGKKKKAGRDIWINLLDSNKYVNECVQEYEEIENPKNKRRAAAMFIGYFSGSFYYLLLLVVTIYVSNIFNLLNSWSPVYSTSIAFFSSSILAIILALNIDKRNKDKTLLNETGRIGSLIIFVNEFIFFSLFATFFFMAIFITKTGSFDIIINDININNLWYVSSVTFLFVAIVISKKNRRDFLDYSKILLNSKYLYQFPYVRITTKSIEIEGKISEIFDENLIILDCGRFRNAVEWDTITHLELRKF